MNRRSQMQSVLPSFLRTLLFLLIINLSTFAETAAQNSICTGIRVHGRVVDKDRIPAKAIDVFLEPKKYVAFASDRFISSRPTNEKGEFVFCVDADFAKAQGQWMLFTSKLDSRGLIDLVRPPYDLVREFDPAFNGSLVDLGKGDVELGDVPITFYHQMVSLSLGRITNNRQFDEKFLRDIVIRIKNIKGQIAAESSLSILDIQNLIQLRTSSVEVTLPRGDWQVEILNGANTIGQSTIFQVESEGNCIQINPVRG